MKKDNDNVSRVENDQEVKVEDLPIDNADQDMVKGGISPSGRKPGTININS